MSFKKQFQPIFAFIAFFKGNLQFGYKIGLALGVICLVDIGTDAGSASQELIGEGGFALDGITEIDGIDGELHRQVDKNIIGHKTSVKNEMRFAHEMISS